MLRTRIARFAVAGALTVVPIAAAVGFAAGSASASPNPFVGIKCKVLTGTISTTVTLSTCNGNTGGATIAEPVSTLTAGGTVTWVNSDTTTFGSPTLTTVTGSAKTCASTATEEKATGAVTADTTGSAPVASNYKIFVCVASSGKLTLAPRSTRHHFKASQDRLAPNRVPATGRP